MQTTGTTTEKPEQSPENRKGHAYAQAYLDKSIFMTLMSYS